MPTVVGSRKALWFVVGSMVLGLAAAAVIATGLNDRLFITSPGTADLDDLTIVGGSVGDIVLDDASTFEDVVGLIGDLDDDADVTVAVEELADLPAGLIANGAVAVSNGDVDGQASVAFLGDFSFTDVDGLGFDGVRLAVVATWEDQTTAGPAVAVLLNLANQSAAAADRVNLSRLFGITNDIPLGSLIIGVGSDGYEVAAFDDDSGDADSGAFSTFLDDGNDATDDTFPLAGGANTLNLLLAGGALDDVTAELESTDGVRLAGSLTDGNGLAFLNGGSTPSIEAFSVTAAIAATTPSYFPEWVDIEGTWTFGASYDGSSVTGVIGGGITVTPDGETEAGAEFSAELTLGEEPSFAFEAEFTNITGLFGQDWFELSTATLAGEVSSDGFGASFEGEFALAGATGTMAFSIEVSGSDISVSASLDAEFDDLSASAIISAIDNSVSIDEAILDVQINSVSLAIDYTSLGGDTELFVGLFGSTTLTIGQANPNVDLLFRVAFVDGDVSLYGAAKGSDFNLADIDPIIGAGFDWTLPELTIIVSTDEAEPVPFADLDGPTAAFFESILCEDPADPDSCVDFEMFQGVELLSSVELPDTITNSFEEIGIVGTSGPLLISGRVPLFGSTDPISLAVEFPEVESGEDAMVAGGSFAIVVNVDDSGLSVEAGIEGSMVFRITRPDQDECFFPAPDPDGVFPTSQECYDELTLTLSASIIFDATTGSASIELRGEISEWDNAFGLTWLQVNQFALTLRFNAEAGGGVTIDVVIAAGITIDETDITFAASVTFTSTPPWLLIKGITVGTRNGISLPQLAEYFGLPTGGLPDLSIRNAWFAWGSEDDPENCIVRGLFISAELHLGAVNDGDVEPGCSGGSDALDDLAAGIGDSCADSDTCLAGIRLEVLPDQPRFFAQVTINGFTAGPVDFEPTDITLLVTPTVQRLTFSAGVTLRDPLTNSDDEWASGSIELELSQDSGNILIAVEAQVTLAGDFVSAYVHGSASGDFGQFTGGDFVAFLDSLDLSLQVELSFPGLEKLGEDIVGGLEDAGEYLEDAGEEIEDFFVNDVSDGIESAVDDVGDFFSDPFGSGGGGSSEAELLALQDLFELSPSEFETVIDDIENFIAGIPFVSRQNARDAVQPLRDAFEVREAVLDGATAKLDFGIYTWDKSTDGGCESGGDIEGDPICDAAEASATEIADRSIEPVIDEQLGDGTGLAVPSSGGDAVDVARDLAGDLTGQQLDIECFAFDYETPDQAEFGADFFGVDIGQGSVDYSSGFTVSSTSGELNQAGLDLNQDGLDTAVAGNGQTSCSAPTEPPFAAGSTFFISTTEIDEGQQVRVWGSAIAGLGISEFFIDWGDGTTSSIEIGEVLTFDETKVYPDDTGDGPANNFVISLAADAVPFIRQHKLTVNNVDPVLSNLAVSESSIDEGDTVTLTGDVSDVGIEDTHVVKIVWGDGTRETVTLAPGATSFSVDHTYTDDADPVTSARAASTDYTIRARLIDDDTGVDKDSTTVTVNNVTPGEPVLQTVTVNGDDVPTTGDTPLIPDGEEATWTWTVIDPGLDDALYFVVEWGDGTFSTSAPNPSGQPGDVTVTSDPNDPSIKTVTVTHTYTGQNNGTVFDLRLEVFDKDTQTDPEYSQPLIIGVDVGTDFSCFVSSSGSQFTVTIVNPVSGAVDYEVYRAAENGYDELLIASFSAPDISTTFDGPAPGLDQVIEVRTQIPDTPDFAVARCGQIDVDDPDADIGIDKVFTGYIDNDGDGVISAGDTLEYTITATNTGTVELTNVTVEDNLTGASTTCVGPVAVDETCVLEATWVVLFSQVGTSIPNVATADSDQTGSVTDTELVPVPDSAALSIEKSFVDFADNDGSTDMSVGDELNYLIVATNEGPSPLTDVVVDDDLTGATTTCSGPVAAGETCELETSYTVVANDLGTTVTNTATANSNETDEVSDTVDVPIGTPGLSVDKEFIGYLDNDGSSDISVGDDLVYRLTATNSGETGLTGLTMVDDLTGETIDCTLVRNPHLAGQTCSGTVQYTVTASDLGTTVTNTATADSVQAGPVTDTVAVAIGTAAIGIDKEYTGFADNDGSTDITPGDFLEYSIVATNTGTANLTNVVVRDDLTSAFRVCPGPVLSGGTCELQTSYTVLLTDVGTTVTNTATATSNETEEVSDTAEVPVPGSDPVFLLEIDKEYTGFTDNDTSGGITPGDDLNYTIVATNIGDSDLTNVTINDDLTGAAQTCAGPVAPGGTCELTTSYRVTDTDVGTTVTNTATADSDETDPPVTDTVDVPVPDVVTGDPALGIKKTFTGYDDRDGSSTITEADELQYRIVATNIGDVDLTNLVVEDDLTGATTTCAGPVTPGETCELTTGYIVLATDVGTTVTNTATADSDQTDPPVTDTVDVPVPSVEPAECPATALSFDQRQLFNRDDRESVTVDGSIRSGIYTVRLFSSDEHHAPGVQTDQTQEQWRLEMLDAAGQVLYSSPPIADLPDALNEMSELVDDAADIPDGVVQFRAQHVRLGDSINSVIPACAELVRLGDGSAGPPVNDLTFELDDVAQPGNPINLDGEFTVGLEPFTLAIDWGDGTGCAGGSGGCEIFRPEHGMPGLIQASHTYDLAGVYTVKVTVTDALGASVTTSVDTAACTILGTASAETIQGTDDDDVICGLAGNDRIFGNGGNDIIFGGSGNDRIDGRDGDDIIFGGTESDTIDGGDGVDTISGGRGNDILRGGDNDDVLFGRNGNDQLFGELGNDVMEGNQGNDRGFGGDGDDTMRGGRGNDNLQGQDGNDSIAGGQGRDTLTGGNGDDSLSGGTGIDNLLGGVGNDHHDGGDQRDRCTDSSGTNTFVACEL